VGKGSRSLFRRIYAILGSEHNDILFCEQENIHLYHTRYALLRITRGLKSDQIIHCTLATPKWLRSGTNPLSPYSVGCGLRPCCLLRNKCHRESRTSERDHNAGLTSKRDSAPLEIQITIKLRQKPDLDRRRPSLKGFDVFYSDLHTLKTCTALLEILLKLKIDCQ
jgi:hypothetical protein